VYRLFTKCQGNIRAYRRTFPSQISNDTKVTKYDLNEQSYDRLF